MQRLPQHMQHTWRNIQSAQAVVHADIAVPANRLPLPMSCSLMPSPYRNSPKPHGHTPELHHNHRVPQAHDMQDHLQVSWQAPYSMQEQDRGVSTAEALAQGPLQGVGSTTQHHAGVHAEAWRQRSTLASSCRRRVHSRHV